MKKEGGENQKVCQPETDGREAWIPLLIMTGSGMT